MVPNALDIIECPEVVRENTSVPQKMVPEAPYIIPQEQEIPTGEPHDPFSHQYNLGSRQKRANAVVNKTTGKPEEYSVLVKGPDQHIWEQSYINDLGRLAQGIDNIAGTNTIFFIPHYDVPKGKKVTYGKKEISIRPNKAETHSVRLTVGGDKLTFDGDTTTQCASLITTKILLNSVISTPNARFGTIDIKNMYYGTPMKDYEYMRIKFSEIQTKVVEKYNLQKFQHNGWVYLQIRKGMPGIKQAGKIANERLTKHLERYVYI